MPSLNLDDTEHAALVALQTAEIETRGRPIPSSSTEQKTGGRPMRRSLFVAIVAGALAVFAPAYAADPQTFKTEDSATKFCKAGNVVWFNPESKIYFDPGSRFYGKTKAGGFTCRAFADKAGFRANKGN